MVNMVEQEKYFLGHLTLFTFWAILSQKKEKRPMIEALDGR